MVFLPDGIIPIQYNLSITPNDTGDFDGECVIEIEVSKTSQEQLP